MRPKNPIQIQRTAAKGSASRKAKRKGGFATGPV